MKISNIRTRFGAPHEPKDQKMIKLMIEAYKGLIKCRVAIIKTDAIVPFSTYKPIISKEFRNYLEVRLKENVYSHLFGLNCQKVRLKMIL